jgi:3-hydroxyacyl-CoA dehydrogenase/enoyl-CoA hydratase/3-hydroxybutyryl-CoA epimerase
MFGIGFPAWTGGALQFVFSEGLDNFVNNCRQLAQQHGQGFDLSPAVIDCLHKHAT